MRKVIIMGAAGRDFHNFNVFFRNNPDYRVVGFTATQIPNITDRRYPKEIAGKRYPSGIPIFPEQDLTSLVKKHRIGVVVFAYSDVPHQYVMSKASEVLAAGADFWLIGPDATMLKSRRKVISICASRTGSGKSQTTRRVCEILKQHGVRFSVVRHPMPYGDLRKQVVQKFSTMEDLDRHHCTIEEREEYEPHLKRGTTVFAGVDYGLILKAAEKISDVVIWDGGNNDLPFYRPDLHIVVTDPLRVGHELTYHPGETNVRMADVVVINKIDTASKQDVARLRANIRSVNANAQIIEAASPTTVDDPSLIRGKRVVVVEDGPTLTHGEMAYGAGVVTARAFGAKPVDPRRYAVGSIKRAYIKYPQIGALIPALGYSPAQIKELARTINNTPADAIIIATPVDLRKSISMNKPAVKVNYELKEKDGHSLEPLVLKVLR